MAVGGRMEPSRSVDGFSWFEALGMSDQGEAIEARIARARGGDRDERIRLLRESRQLVRSAAERRAKAEGWGSLAVENLAAKAIEEGVVRFDDFEGATEEDLAAWLGTLVGRIADEGGAAPAPAATRKGVHDATSGGSEAAASAPSDSDQPTLDGTAAPPGWQRLTRGGGATPSGSEHPPMDGARGRGRRGELEGGSTSVDSEEPTLDGGLAPADSEQPTLDGGAAVSPASEQLHEMPTLAPAPSDAPPRPPVAKGRSFGDYELLDVIAKGGMGVVYKARQKKLNRIVALKMILAGQFADQRDVERFYVEAEAAANLRHPNIVSVHEVGEAEGQHYFSMDYVEGRSLADLVQEGPLPPRRAAELTRQIAEAIEFAHRRGILHRDMKPSNILLDESGSPMITDFGLAKRVGGESHLTMTGTVVGTPSYMPPEQAAGRVDEASPASDIYSTGALLYELLTGAPPFRAASPLETLRQVLHNEPPSPRILNPGIPADLETITLKCLQKEPSRRYASAQELADELGRYLAGEPIRARPVSRLERCVRWCRRNPKLAGLSAALVFSLLLATGVFVHSYFRTSAALAKAEQSLQQALRSVDELFTTVSENRLLNEPGAQSLRKELLEKARDLYRQILAQQGDNPAVRDELALSYYRLGRILAEVDRPGEAMEAYQTAKQMQERLAAARPDDPSRLDALADTWNAMGVALDRTKAIEQSLGFHQRALDARAQLARAHPQQWDYRRKWASSLMNVGLLEKERGQWNRAESSLKSAQARRLEILKNEADSDGQLRDLVRRDLAMGYYNLASLARDQRVDALRRNDKEAASRYIREAIRYFEKAIETFEDLLARRPENLKNQYRLATCYRLLGKEKVDLPDLDGAIELYEKALERIEPLAEKNADVHEYQTERAAVLADMGAALIAKQPPEVDRALPCYRRAVDILTPLVQAYPTVASYRLDLARTLRALGIEELLSKQFEQALPHLREALAHLERLVQQDPDDAAYQQERDEMQGLINKLIPPK